MKLVLATRNAGKVREIARLLADLPIEIVSAADVGAPDVVEDGVTFEENARKKAEAIARVTGLAALADDSGLEVDALGGAPGVRSARFAGEGATDAANNALLVARLEGRPPPWTARYRAVVALAAAGRDTVVAAGSSEGEIVAAPRGTGGFGYDPHFLDRSLGRTYAQLSAAQKDARSHRGRALRAIRPAIEALLR